SLEYMRGDRRFTYYYAALSLFTASMLLLVVADNTLQLLVGWELVGLCSFMLIGHWWEEKPNSCAAGKVFLTTRTGYSGLIVGVVYLGARLYPVFWYGLSIGTPGHGGLNAMAVIGGITVIIGAALAFVQDDIKKVLAYSTISQLGYMVMALGIGAWTAAVFHLF